MKHILPRVFGLLLLATALVGCGGFDKEFKALASQPPPNDVSGAWIGTWQNTNNSHGGDLYAIVVEASPGVYFTSFKATYGKFMTFKTHATLRGTTRGGTAHFQGEEDLGWLAGGVYTYDGYATPQEFFSTYTSKNDEGTYTMRRPLVVAE